MTQRYFITGTDTEIGKTYVTCRLARQWREQGKTVACSKPVASDAEWVDGKLVNDDALKLQQAESLNRPLEQINPYCFEPAIAPHIAANEAGVDIQLDVITQSILQPEADVVLIEGFGGWLAPVFLGDDKKIWQADIARAVDAAVILVVGMRLGCLNHAQLSANKIIADGFTLHGWVANRIDPDMANFDENLATLEQLLPAPLLATVGWDEASA